jgi:hypothetical protein
MFLHQGFFISRRPPIHPELGYCLAIGSDEYYEVDELPDKIHDDSPSRGEKNCYDIFNKKNLEYKFIGCIFVF